MKTNVQNYIDFLEGKESQIKQYIFSPRTDKEDLLLGGVEKKKHTRRQRIRVLWILYFNY